MIKNITTFLKFFITMFIALTLQVKMTGNKFKIIDPIPWNDVFSHYMLDILIKSLVVSTILFVAYWLIKKKKAD